MTTLLLLAASAGLQPQTVLTVDPAHRLIEGVTSNGRAIWLSSLIDRQILACGKSCKTLTTLPEGIHPFAIAWDRQRQRLWVAADCPPKVSFIKACERGALLALDRKGRIVNRITPDVAGFHPGDVSVSDGKLFVSDSQNGVVYQLRSDGKSLKPLVSIGTGKSAQGSVYDQANNRLIVADYSQGITAIDLSTNQRTLILRDNGRPLRGIDGLARCGNEFVGVYNGQSPSGLVAFSIADGKIKVREALPGHSMPDPTQVASDGTRLLVVSDSGWPAALKGETSRPGGAPIVAIPLSAVCPG